MAFNPAAIKNVDQSTVEEEGLALPFIQYNNGNPGMKQLGKDSMGYAGGWFIPEANVYEDLSKRDGWTKEPWVRDGGDTLGFYKRDIEVAVIAYRQRWEVWQGNGKFPAQFSWADYDRAKAFGQEIGKWPSGRLQVALFLRGLEDLNTMMITLRGYASKMFKGSNNSPGAMSSFKNIVIAAANAASREKGFDGKWPTYAFWMKVGPDRDAKGNPKFTAVGSGTKSKVALIQPIGLPDKPQEVDLSEYYVGDDLLRRGEEAYNDLRDWAEAWDNLGSDPNKNGSVKEEEEDALPEEEMISADELQDGELNF